MFIDESANLTVINMCRSWINGILDESSFAMASIYSDIR